LGKPFPHEKYLGELTELRDKLKFGLSASAHDAGEGEGPCVSELAERIKALKAANTIEAAPQRVERKQAEAEEPVTARIRRRQEANTVVSQSGDHDASKEHASEVQPAEKKESPGKMPMNFRERILTGRQSDGQGPSLA
jgi:hypothetical protein